MKKPNKILWIVGVSLLVLAAVLRISQPAAGVEQPKVDQQVVQPEVKPQLVEHDFIRAGENTVHLGDLADDALPKLKSYIISNAGHRPDPRPGMSGSMMVWYHCDTEGGQTWTVELARMDMDGPYVVYRITEGEHNYQLGEK